MTPEELPKVLRVAREQNSQANITGMLAYGGGMFVQWLEGPRTQVRSLMDKLQHDPRHHCIVELHAFAGVHERLYPDWSMQWVEASDIQAVLADAHERAKNERHAHAIALMQELLHQGPLQPIASTCSSPAPSQLHF